MSFGKGSKGQYGPRKSKGNKFYRRGANFERAFIQELSAGEYHLYAVRSAGSHGSLDVLEIQVSEGDLSVWGYQLKCGKEKPVFSEVELDYLEFLEDSGINVRIVWKRPHSHRETHTVESARERFLPLLERSTPAGGDTGLDNRLDRVT